MANKKAPPAGDAFVLVTQRGARLASLAGSTAPKRRSRQGAIDRIPRGSHPRIGKRNDRPKAVISFGDPAGIRTPDTLLKRQVLCRLSKRSIYKG